MEARSWVVWLGVGVEWFSVVSILVLPGSPAMPAAIGALASWTLAGCRPANVAGSFTQVSVTCGSPTGPTASIWTGSTPAARRLHPERGGNTALAAATAVPNGSPGPWDGGGRGGDLLAWAHGQRSLGVP